MLELSKNARIFFVIDYNEYYIKYYLNTIFIMELVYFYNYLIFIKKVSNFTR